MTSPHTNKAKITEPWGKSAGLERCHPLVCHMIDTFHTARVLSDLLLVRGRMRTELRKSLGALGEKNTREWVAFFCAIHDLGKYSPSFQALNLPLAATRIGPWGLHDVEFVAKPAGFSGHADTPHGLLTTFHLQNLLESWGATRETAATLAAVAGGHHGHFPSGQEITQVRGESNSRGGQAWEAATTDLVLQVAELCGLPDPRRLPWRDVQLSVPNGVALAALTTVSDWVASDRRNFEPPEAVFDLAAYADDARKRTEQAVARLNMAPWRPTTSRFDVLFDSAPRPVQGLVERLTADLDEPALLLIEAPTGDGKTKAALQAAAALVRRLDLAGFYFALPTQASSRQTRKVVEKMQRALGDPTDVHLVYAGALQTDSTQPAEVGLDEVGDSDVAARTWFTRKLALLAALGCGTIDQALKATFRSGHVFVRLTGLAGKVVVIDEVHAYDTYMSTTLARLLTWLGALGVPVVLLSATLPAGRRHDLIAAWQAGARGCYPHEIPAAPTEAAYPRVALAKAAGDVEYLETTVSEVNENRTVHLEHVPDGDVVDWLLAEAAKGRCVAVVHNLVRRAVETYDELEKRIATLPERERPLLVAINGTLPEATRRKVENELEGFFGENGARPQRAIVVGTQVLEQSLDLDFDRLLTDLAPIDSMLQRVGRVHRHQRGAERGRLVMAITGVSDTATGPQFPRYTHAVYAPIVLLRTWTLLRELSTIESWTEVAELVEKVYSDQFACPLGWEAAWNQATQRLATAHHNDKMAAAGACLPLPHLVEELHELTGYPRPIRTRKNSGGRR
ncbi:CRISPR-associated helicase Cas3' [Amycolatopsis sp. RTGN1]|uniref:CRISPR-associated helicase Cas3' n=1 Tax=Amycolatopsis ponsaeliensis TaxID=2992142 RepID=UPI0025505829|nr:CRISPR-associated helicase Cas3' [Amycolatopsis sp. RTGN1]